MLNWVMSGSLAILIFTLIILLDLVLNYEFDITDANINDQSVG